MSVLRGRPAVGIAAAVFGASLASAQTPLTTEKVASGLSRPLFITHAPGDHSRLFIVEQRPWTSTHYIRVLDLSTNQVLPTPFLTVSDISVGNSRGILGFAFHPDYENNGYFYINYTRIGGTTRVLRYRVSASDPNVADPNSALQLLSIPQPSDMHDAAWMGFGPDGYLYILTGDGGPGGDPNNRSQTIQNELLGKILRIDVDGDDFPSDPNRNYAIPPTNPFVGKPGDDEIWAYGARMPYRGSFDRLTGDLYFADVGQAQWEEINFQPASSIGGENYGWRCYEGDAPYNLGGCADPSTMVFPIHKYPIFNLPECAIIGGYVYRGGAIPDLGGTYFFGDYCARRIWSFRFDGANITQFQDRTAELQPAAGGEIGMVITFGEDAAGEHYIGTLQGDLFRIIPDGPVCYPDCDNSGTLDFFDFLCFQNAFLAGEPYADCDGSGTLDFFDFLCFQNEFLAGCP